MNDLKFYSQYILGFGSGPTSDVEEWLLALADLRQDRFSPIKILEFVDRSPYCYTVDINIAGGFSAYLYLFRRREFRTSKLPFSHFY